MCWPDDHVCEGDDRTDLLSSNALTHFPICIVCSVYVVYYLYDRARQCGKTDNTILVFIILFL